MQRASVMVEICVGDVESAVAAEAGGADRVELCDNLAVGGTTPGPGSIALACERLQIPVHVIIRPRGGDFVMSPLELEIMGRDIAAARSLGAAGVVLGVLHPDGTIDRDGTAGLVARARPLAVIFHKAFDQTPDPIAALETLIALGIDGVLTSGGQARALEGGLALERLQAHARGRIQIMAGGGITLDDIEPLVTRHRLERLHFGSAAAVRDPGRAPAPPRDGSDASWSRVDPARVAALVARARAAVSR